MSCLYNMKFSCAKEVTKFCQKIENEIESDVFGKSGRYTVNAKSILGILSLESMDITIVLDSDNKEEVKSFMRICSEFGGENGLQQCD